MLDPQALESYKAKVKEGWTLLDPAAVKTQEDRGLNPEFKYWTLKDNVTTRILKYTFEVYGTQPDTGFPLFIALHGGGGPTVKEPDATLSNNGDWQVHATKFYGTCIKDVMGQGVFIAVRGVVDAWNLHFRDGSYPLFQRLIRNLLLPDPREALTTPKNSKATTFIDPDRVHLLGFSAGGDGVYRLAEVLSDHLAGVNMSAGHPGATKIDNLANIPICLQVGDQDGNNGRGEARRNQVTVKFGQDLKALHEKRRIRDTMSTVSSCILHKIS
jgi:predicted peptidase